MINGTEVQNNNAGAMVQVSRYQNINGVWTYASHSSYNTLSSSTADDDLNTFLVNTVKTGDLIIINTTDEPSNNAGYKATLESSFFAEHTTFGYRSNYLLIAIKGVERIYEKYNSSGWQSVTAYVPVSYTHLTLPTKRIV